MQLNLAIPPEKRAIFQPNIYDVTVKAVLEDYPSIEKKASLKVTLVDPCSSATITVDSESETFNFYYGYTTSKLKEWQFTTSTTPQIWC